METTKNHSSSPDAIVVAASPSEKDHLLPLPVKKRSRRYSISCVGWIFAAASLLIIGNLALLFLKRESLQERSRSSSVSMGMDIDRAATTHSNRNSIRPGSIFLDTNGNPINAHGGGFLFHNNTYYWYGEIKNGETYLPKENANWGGTRVDLTGISCYSSQDLIQWTYVGNVLPAVYDDPSHDLYYATGIMERPKVVYNSYTNKFVMWLHVDAIDYKLARSGVAVSDSPTGPFTYLQSVRPNGQMARDLTVFVDKKPSPSPPSSSSSTAAATTNAYLITSSEDNAVMHIHELSSNYTSFTGKWERIFENRYMEAPTFFQHNGRYYFIGSGCTAWDPNKARSAVSYNSIWGPWIEFGNPCKGYDANTTFQSQSTYVLPLLNNDNNDGGVGEGGRPRFMFAADRWNAKNLSDSRYVWLPIRFDDEEPVIEWRDEWDFSIL